MLRGPKGFLQSLHSFSYHGSHFLSPVLLKSTLPLVQGEVVELVVQRTEDSTNVVHFPKMKRREVGKQPNFLWAAMDVISAGLNVEALLRP